MRQRLRFTGIALIICAVLALVFISIFAVSGRTEAGSLQGRVLLWHAYQGSEADALVEMIDRFRNIYPGVTVMVQGFPSTTALQEEYLSAVDTGLGPDVLVGPSAWIASLAPTGQVAALDARIPEDTWQRYTAATLDTVTYRDSLYGLPLALNTLALYYNRSVVSNTVSTTDALEREAAQEAIVLMSTTFRDAYWGINAFGGRLFDEEFRVVLDQGGFANWLAWLSNLRNYPGVILDNNRDALRARFLQGDAAFYFGYAWELNLILDELGLENVGVSPLPAGPIANAQPLLDTTAFMFSPVSSANQRRLALELGQFLSNSEQSGALMRRVRLVPANQRVRINPRLNPIVSSFATQARAASPLLNTEEMEAALRLGTDAYLRVLDGGIPAAEAAVAVTSQINEANNVETAARPQLACTSLGTIRLLHTWEGVAADALATLIQRFRSVCPLIIVDAEFAPPHELVGRLANAVPGAGRPHAVLSSPDLFGELIGEELLIREVSPLIPSELLQRFQPNALDTMRYNRTLYGLPVYLEVDALYYNAELTGASPLTVDDLRTQAGQGVNIELDINFKPAFWGISAFGGRLFDAENRVILDQGGAVEWLNWLNESRESFGMQLQTDSDLLRSRFESGQTAYYVGSSAQLPSLLARMGPDVLGVAEFPDGPGGNANPLLSSQGFFLTQAATETQIALLLEFVQFVTGSDSQRYLAEEVGLVPVNATIEPAGGGHMDTLMNIARGALAPPNTFHMQTVRELGDDYYRRVLEDGEPAALVVQEVTAAINEANGVAPLPTPEPAPAPVETPLDDEQLPEEDLMPDPDAGAGPDGAGFQNPSDE